MLNRRSIVLAAPSLLLSGCRRKKSASAVNPEQNTIKLIMSDIGFNDEVEPILKQELVKRGIVLDWVVVNDIVQPNEMVDAGESDANYFQHLAYFDQFVHDHALKNIVPGFYTLYTPSGLYSHKYKSLSDVPDGAIFGIPVDPANNGRALFMLQDHGLLRLRPDVDVIHASLDDIVDNPHHFKFLQVDQQMLQRTYQDVDVAFLFSLYALQLGLDPVKNALAIETQDGSKTSYKGVVAIQRNLVGARKVKALQAAFASDAIKTFYRQKYGDAVVFLDNLNH